jgi:peptidoglycan/LPS O-acetylase OafA/YrhL
MRGEQGQVPVLNGLRAVSILLVLGAHLFPLGPKVLQLNGAAGAMGMALFFSLSGFLITSQLQRGTPVSAFLVRRLARILPLAYAYLAIASVLIGLSASYPVWTATFTVNYATEWLTGSYNSHFWSLCVEVQFYLAIALVVALGGRRTVLIVWPACLLVTIFRVSQGEVIAIQTHLRVDEILIGACIATVFAQHKPAERGMVWLLGACALWVVCSHPTAGALQYLRPYATGAVLWVALGLSQGWMRAFLVSRPMAYVADISYGLYIIHPITAHGWMNEGSLVERYLIKRPISIAVTFALAHFSRFTWEQYWTDAARRWKPLSPRSDLSYRRS